MAKPKKPKPKRATKADLAALICEIVGGDQLKVERSSNRAELVDLLEQARESVTARTADLAEPIAEIAKAAEVIARSLTTPSPGAPPVPPGDDDEDTKVWAWPSMTTAEASQRARLARAGVTEPVMAGLATILDHLRSLGPDLATALPHTADAVAAVDWMCDLGPPVSGTSRTIFNEPG